VKDHRISVKGYPQRNMHVADVANHARVVMGQPPIGSGYFNPATVALDPETGQGKPFATYVYATQIAEVDVDDETGEVEVLRIAASHDLRHRDQSDAGRGTGRGRDFDGGRLRAAGGDPVRRQGSPGQSEPDQLHHAHRRSTCPRSTWTSWTTSNPTGPFGAKGVGEPHLRVHGGRDPQRDSRRGRRAHHSLPATAEKVHAAIKAKREQEMRSADYPHQRTFSSVARDANSRDGARWSDFVRWNERKVDPATGMDIAFLDGPHRNNPRRLYSQTGATGRCAWTSIASARIG
jgi:hypothetical protein